MKIATDDTKTLGKTIIRSLFSGIIGLIFFFGILGVFFIPLGFTPVFIFYSFVVLHLMPIIGVIGIAIMGCITFYVLKRKQ